jgi:hypothetical protein
MRVVYLDSTREDLLWMRHYCEVIFPEGLKKAQDQFYSVEKLLLVNPFMGHKTHQKDVFEFSIPKKLFSYIYTVRPKQIAILRVWDARQRDRHD